MSFLEAESPQIPAPQLVVVEPDTPQRLYLSGLFGSANGAAALRDVPLNFPSVIVLGPSVSQSQKALDEAEMILISHPDITAILVTVGEVVPQEMMEWALRANVKAVVAYESPPDDIRSAVDRARQILFSILSQSMQKSFLPQGAPQGPKGKIVVVFSPKGGVGKSTISINLAVQMAVESPPDSIGLIDADLQFGDVSIMLRISSTQNLASIMESKDRINPETYRYSCATHKSGLRVLPAPADPAYSDLVDPPNILDVLDAMRSFVDVTVVDTAPIVNDLNILILEQADKILIPVNPDLPSVKNVAIVLKTLRALGIRNNQIGIILNKADRKNPSQQKEIEKTLDAPVIAVIPDDPLVRSAVNEGYPFVTTATKSQATKAMVELARQLLPTYSVTPSGKKKDAPPPQQAPVTPAVGEVPPPPSTPSR